MSRFNDLYLGEPAVAAETLENSSTDVEELRLALINALRRISELEKRLAPGTYVGWEKL